MGGNASGSREKRKSAGLFNAALSLIEVIDSD
jgi:hypothetical protein